uniref:Uncharacterized protein n=1 Tax=Eutreptiella gymnastica TaxID=73025 RepID=A0A7S1NA51_9EUGL
MDSPDPYSSPNFGNAWGLHSPTPRGGPGPKRRFENDLIDTDYGNGITITSSMGTQSHALCRAEGVSGNHFPVRPSSRDVMHHRGCVASPLPVVRRASQSVPGHLSPTLTSDPLASFLVDWSAAERSARVPAPSEESLKWQMALRPKSGSPKGPRPPGSPGAASPRGMRSRIEVSGTQPPGTLDPASLKCHSPTHERLYGLTPKAPGSPKQPHVKDERFGRHNTHVRQLPALAR